MNARPSREEIYPVVENVLVDQLGITRDQVIPTARIVEDFGCDSLDSVELLMSIEDEFGIGIPEDSGNPALEFVFTKPDFNVQDLVDLVYMQLGSYHTPPPLKLHPPGIFSLFRKDSEPVPEVEADPSGIRIESFTHWDGEFDHRSNGRLHRESLSPNLQGYRVSKRSTDGMCCVHLPSNHVVYEDIEIDIPNFLIDIEPVSTTAYARFLNSIAEDLDQQTEQLWLAREPWDRRGQHFPLEKNDSNKWKPRPGTETWPMILVSWYGANAYALWANGADWTAFRDESPWLPTGRQFEYAARGKHPQQFPWGDHDASPALAVVECHRYRASYQLPELPIQPVNACLGQSPFGLRHMAGNVWHWCREWVDAEKQEIRMERGGSWIGSADLAQCDYYRGRIPSAKGRCLGFRCVADDVSGD